MDTDAEDDLTPLEYAQFHGLATNHEAQSSPVTQIDAIRESVQTQLTDDGPLKTIEAPICVNTEERLFNDQKAALLLQEASGTRSVDVESAINSLLDGRAVKMCRVELPLLRTDHQHDVKAFAASVKALAVIKNLPVEPLDIEADQGLEWPRRLKRLHTEYLEQSKKDRITISKDVLLYAQTSLVDQWTNENDLAFWETALYYRRVSAACYRGVLLI